MSHVGKRIVSNVWVLSLIIVGLAAVSGCSSSPTEASGVYHYGLEDISLRAQGHPGETWWLEPSSVPERIQRALPPNIPSYDTWAFVRLYGVRSRRGRYGHLGMYERSFRVLGVLAARPATVNELRDAGVPEEWAQKFGGPSQR